MTFLPFVITVFSLHFGRVALDRSKGFDTQQSRWPWRPMGQVINSNVVWFLAHVISLWDNGYLDNPRPLSGGLATGNCANFKYVGACLYRLYLIVQTHERPEFRNALA